MIEKLEDQIASQTAAGREGLAVWQRVIHSMTGPDKVAKSFELTEMTREIMRAGIRSQHPDASEEEIRDLYVDRLLRYNGTTLEEVRRRQRSE